MTEQDPGHEHIDVPLTDLKPSLEALLMVADQPLDQVTLASAVGHPVAGVEGALASGSMPRGIVPVGGTRSVSPSGKLGFASKAL